MTDQIINKKHPYWRAVYVRLNDGLINYGCNNTVEITKRILISLPNVDAEGTLSSFREEYSVYCDCGILAHVFNDEPELKRAD